MLKILLIRHGECTMNLELANKIGGRSNCSPLTDLGERQSKILGKHLRKVLIMDWGLDPKNLQYFASNAVRASSTATIAMKEIGINPHEHLNLSNDLLEQSMGKWEGAVRSECYSPENLALIEADTFNFASPNGESQKDVEERMMNYLHTQVLPLTQAGIPSLVFGHGMSFKCVLRNILGSDARMTRKIAIDNCAITEIGWVSDETAKKNGLLQQGWHILRVNDSSHVINL